MRASLVFLVGCVSAQQPHDPQYYQEKCDRGEVVDCVVTPNWAWSTCSTTCGQGITTRSRTVIHEACNGGAECPATKMTRECMLRVCDCSHVICKWEVQHTCKQYTEASPWCGHNHDYTDPNTCPPTVYHDVDDYVTEAFILGGKEQHNGRYGTGDSDGNKLTDDHHDHSSTCAPADSVRVYHSNVELAGAGHHCKHTKGGACKCRCNSLFKDKDNVQYNPRTLDLFDHSIAPPVDAPTKAPTSYPTRHPDQPFAITIASGAWETCSNWESTAEFVPRHAGDAETSFCPIDCSLTTVEGPSDLSSPETVQRVKIVGGGKLHINEAKLTIQSESSTCCQSLPGVYTQTATSCQGG